MDIFFNRITKGSYSSQMANISVWLIWNGVQKYDKYRLRLAVLINQHFIGKFNFQSPVWKSNMLTLEMWLMPYADCIWYAWDVIFNYNDCTCPNIFPATCPKCASAQSDQRATLTADKSVISHVDSVTLRSDSSDGRADQELHCPHIAYYPAYCNVESH